MKNIKKTILFLSLINLAVLSAPVVAQEPVNLQVHKNRLIKYHDSGEYQRDIEKVIQNAITHLKKELSHRNSTKYNRKPTIVLDIDETALSNYRNFLNLSFGGNPKLWNEAEQKAEAPAIPATLKLYQVAKANGVAVVFMTGRHEGRVLRAATAKNLKKAGYNNWDQLILKPAAYHHKPGWLYKAAMRKQLTQNGHDIILNIGDQKSDLIGGYSQKSLKLPNPYYFIP